MLLMFERGIRGEITQSVHRWAAANNPYMGSEYDPSCPTKYLQYLDANNLYGWAMSQPLPSRGFHWVEFNEGKDLKYIMNELAKHEDHGLLSNSCKTRRNTAKDEQKYQPIFLLVFSGSRVTKSQV